MKGAPVQALHSSGGSAAATVWLGLYGHFTPHPLDDRRAALDDAYQLFIARSSAMGWLSDAIVGRPVRRWGMNDVGRGDEDGASAPLAWWFQVVLPETGVPDQLLPVQPLLACVGDVVARLGAIDVQALRLVLPVPLAFDRDPPAGVSALNTLAESAGWFEHCDPRARTHLDVTLDGGSSPEIGSEASAIFEWTNRFVQDVFRCDRFSTSVGAPSEMIHGIVSEAWFDAPNHRLTLGGTLAEWSLDALGWTAAFLANACHRNGIRTPVFLTATRSSEPDGRA